MNKIQSETEEIAKRLEEGVRDVFHSQKYMDYLKVMSQFHEYSLNNTLLIMMQRPSASIVAGYNAWKQMGRQVNRGEKGIRILAPSPYTLKVEQTQKNEKGEIIKDQKGNAVKEIVEIKKIAFRPVSVFDVEQTAGKELPQLTSALIGTSEKYRQIFTAISKVSDIPIVTESITGSQIKGYCTRDKIVLNESNSDLQNLKTLVHELAHHKLHFSPENELKSRQTKEVEAESIAYMVCQHFGIDTSEYSFGYIAGWSSGKDVKELKGSLEVIKGTASGMIKRIDESLAEVDKMIGLRKSCLSQLRKNQEIVKENNTTKGQGCGGVEMKNILNCGFTFEEISLILLCQNKERDKIIGELQEYIDAAAPSMKRLLVQTIQKVRIASAEDLECAINYPIDEPLK